MEESAKIAEGSPLLLIGTLKRAAMVLRDAGLPFALAGGAAAYARGAAPPMHDVDFVIREADADAAARAFEAAGLRVDVPPEGWLIKAYDDDRMIDLIFRLAGHPDTRAVLERAEEISVAAVPMPVLTATDLTVAWLAAFSEHHANVAGQIERALHGDPRTHELGVRVEVDAGIIVLRGQVASAERRLLVAQVAAEQAPGLLIRNEVSVTPVLPPEVPRESLS